MPALTQNVNFKCNETICYGIGAAVHMQFMTLQSSINFFAKLGGFPPLLVDGFIGDKTVAAAGKAAVAAGLPSPGSTRQELAGNAQAFTTRLQDVMGSMAVQAVQAIAVPAPEIGASVRQVRAACRADKKDPTCTKAVAMCEQVRGTSTAQLADVAEICAATTSRSWAWWLLGGVAAATGIGLVLYHRKRP